MSRVGRKAQPYAVVVDRSRPNRREIGLTANDPTGLVRGDQRQAAIRDFLIRLVHPWPLRGRGFDGPILSWPKGVGFEPKTRRRSFGAAHDSPSAARVDTNSTPWI